MRAKPGNRGSGELFAEIVSDVAGPAKTPLGFAEVPWPSELLVADHGCDVAVLRNLEIELRR